MTKLDLLNENESFKEAVEKIKELLASLPCEEDAEFDDFDEDPDSEDE